MTHSPLKCQVTDANIVTFQTDGAICLRDAFDQKWIEILRKGIEQNLLNPSAMTKRKGHSPLFFHDYNNWRSTPEYEEFIFQSGAGEIAATLLQSSVIALYSNHVLVKDSGSTKKTPWHQDQAYYEIDGKKVCSIWFPVDPVSKQTCLRLVKGSHTWTDNFKPVRFDGPPFSNYQVKVGHEEEVEKHFLSTPDFDEIKDCQVLSWDMKPGDCIVFHMRMVHGSNGNNLSTPRRAFSTRWIGEDAIKGERPWMNLPPSQEMTGLKQGDNLVESGSFPIVWRSAEWQRQSVEHHLQQRS